MAQLAGLASVDRYEVEFLLEQQEKLKQVVEMSAKGGYSNNPTALLSMCDKIIPQSLLDQVGVGGCRWVGGWVCVSLRFQNRCKNRSLFRSFPASHPPHTHASRHRLAEHLSIDSNTRVLTILCMLEARVQGWHIPSKADICVVKWHIRSKADICFSEAMDRRSA